MAVVNQPYLMGYTDNGESLLIDPDQPSCSSSYEPTPTNVSTEEATGPIKISTEGSKAKKKKVTVVATGSRLPEPCPLPILSERTKDIISNGIKGNNRFFLLREAVIFYEGICPHPSPEEYTIMAKTLCHEYPELKDKQDAYWVSVHVCNYVVM